LCRSFLERCFVKRPEDRATARELLQHPWITANLAAAPPKMYKERTIGVGMGEAEAAAKQVEGEGGSLRQELSAELLCPVLQRPLHDALTVFPCGHNVSEEAWRGHGSMTCPVCNDAVDDTGPALLVRKLVGTVSSAVPPPSVSLGGSSGYFPSPAVSEPTELCQKGSLLATMDEMSLDASAC
jgi:serine/threonine protein kinase